MVKGDDIIFLIDKPASIAAFRYLLSFYHTMKVKSSYSFSAIIFLVSAQSAVTFAESQNIVDGLAFSVKNIHENFIGKANPLSAGSDVLKSVDNEGGRVRNTERCCGIRARRSKF